MTKSIKLITAIVLAAAIAGCSATNSPPNSSDTPTPPTNYKAAVIGEVQSSFFDPYSIRDASISAPLYASYIFDGMTPFPRSAWIVCVKANARNRMGGYAGQQLTLMAFKGEAVDLTLSGPSFEGQLADHCRSAQFSPFPEIEGA